MDFAKMADQLQVMNEKDAIEKPVQVNFDQVFNYALQQFEESLQPHQEAGVIVASGKPFRIREFNPFGDWIVFAGLDDEGSVTTAVQHVSQASLQFVALEKMGYHL